MPMTKQSRQLNVLFIPRLSTRLELTLSSVRSSVSSSELNITSKTNIIINSIFTFALNSLIKACVIGSRDQLCINPQVNEQKSYTTKVITQHLTNY